MSFKYKISCCYKTWNGCFSLGLILYSNIIICCEIVTSVLNCIDIGKNSWSTELPPSPFLPKCPLSHSLLLLDSTNSWCSRLSPAPAATPIVEGDWKVRTCKYEKKIKNKNLWNYYGKTTLKICLLIKISKLHIVPRYYLGLFHRYFLLQKCWKFFLSILTNHVHSEQINTLSCIDSKPIYTWRQCCRTGSCHI